MPKAPIGELADIMDVGFACAYLVTTYARRITGGTIYVDGGVHIVDRAPSIPHHFTYRPKR